VRALDQEAHLQGSPPLLYEIQRHLELLNCALLRQRWHDAAFMLFCQLLVQPREMGEAANDFTGGLGVCWVRRGRADLRML
jgi:hypothetical protein